MSNTSSIALKNPTELQPIDFSSHSLEVVEELTNELKRILVSHEQTLREHEIRQKVEILERWMESYRRGLSAARKISEKGTSILNELTNNLKLAIDERHRLEGEGGSAPSGEESEKIDDLIKTMHHIENMLPDIEQVFHTTEPEPA